MVRARKLSLTIALVLAAVIALSVGWHSGAVPLPTNLVGALLAAAALLLPAGWAIFCGHLADTEEAALADGAKVLAAWNPRTAPQQPFTLADEDDDDPSGPQASLRTISRRLVEYEQRIQEYEQGRALAEVRARRAEQSLESAREVLEGLDEAVVVWGSGPGPTLHNRAARGLLNISEDTPEAWTTALEQRPGLAQALKQFRRGGGRTDRNAELDLPDHTNGTSRSYAVRLAALPGDDPRPSESSRLKAVMIIRDREDLQKLQQRHAQFVASVSHEMKTPLSGIKAYVELLADGDAESVADREEFLEVINSQADRLRRLIDNLLNIARIEAGVIEVEKRDVSLNDILEEALQVVQPAAEQKGLHLETDLSELHLTVHVDRDLLLQAAINLLSNAVKYTPPNGVVRLRSRYADEQALFEVVDTGVGLSPEDCARVFDRFYRVKKDQGMASGTGLGLPLVKHIVEDVHGGAVDVESARDAGSSFRVTLPRAGASAAKSRAAKP